MFTVGRLKECLHNDNVTSENGNTTRASLPRRILYIASQPFYEDRGTPIAVLQELIALSKLNILIDVVTYPIGKDVDLPGIRLVRASNPFRIRSVPVGFSYNKIILDLFLLQKVLGMILRIHYDCIHCVEESIFIGMLCKKLTGIPVIYDMHSVLSEQLRQNAFFRAGPIRWFLLSIERWLVRHADSLVGSLGLQFRVKKMALKQKIWECRFEGCGPRPKNQELVGRLGLKDRPTVLYTGNFASYQGLYLLVQAIPHVLSQIPEVAFVLVGGTDEEIRSMSSLARQHGIANTLQIYSRRPSHEMPDYLSIADVLVLPRPRGENAPLKVFNYIGSQRPIVATRIPAHTSVLSEASAHFVTPDPLALARGIVDVLQNRELSKNLAQAAAMAMAIQGDRNSLQHTLLDVYTHAMKKRMIFPNHRKKSRHERIQGGTHESSKSLNPAAVQDRGND
jgi:glycosyltransferase involved in cell wall biosynthesis